MPIQEPEALMLIKRRVKSGVDLAALTGMP